MAPRKDGSLVVRAEMVDAMRELIAQVDTAKNEPELLKGALLGLYGVVKSAVKPR